MNSSFLSQGQAQNWMKGLGLVEYAWGWGLIESPYNWVSCDQHDPLETEQALKILLEFVAESAIGIYDPLEPLRGKHSSRKDNRERYRRFGSCFPECASPQFRGLLKVGASRAASALRSVLELQDQQDCNLHLVCKEKRTLIVFCRDAGFHLSASSQGEMERFIAIFESAKA